MTMDTTDRATQAVRQETDKARDSVMTEPATCGERPARDIAALRRALGQPLARGGIVDAPAETDSDRAGAGDTRADPPDVDTPDRPDPVFSADPEVAGPDRPDLAAVTASPAAVAPPLHASDMQGQPRQRSWLIAAASALSVMALAGLTLFYMPPKPPPEIPGFRAELATPGPGSLPDLPANLLPVSPDNIGPTLSAPGLPVAPALETAARAPRAALPGRPAELSAVPGARGGAGLPIVRVAMIRPAAPTGIDMPAPRRDIIAAQPLDPPGIARLEDLPIAEQAASAPHVLPTLRNRQDRAFSDPGTLFRRAASLTRTARDLSAPAVVPVGLALPDRPGIAPPPWRGEAVASEPAPPAAGQAGVPRIVVHYTAATGPATARRAALELRQAGYPYVELRAVPFAISRSNIRYYFAQDRDTARGSATALGRDGRPIVVRDFSFYDPLPAPGTVEIWVSG